MTNYTRQDYEDAALAAGYEITWFETSIPVIGFNKALPSAEYPPWQPWHDKAQCFDLMVDAGLDISTFIHDGVSISCTGTCEGVTHEPFDGHPDKASAYMRAICLAAIKKGRALRQAAHDQQSAGT